MKTLLDETIETLNKNGRIEEDVLWIGRGFYVEPHPWHDKDKCKNTWEYFKKNFNFIYDNGFGGEEIPMDLIIVGKDFWLERHSYDGAEWWEFKTMPVEPDAIIDFDIR